MADKPLALRRHRPPQVHHRGRSPAPTPTPAPEREPRHETVVPPASLRVTTSPAAPPTQTVVPPPAGVSLRPPSELDPEAADANGPDLAACSHRSSKWSSPASPSNATADRLDIAIRAANPGKDHPPAMSFDQLVQSVYMQAILQLGGGTQEGQQPQVDILGARQSIDMLGVLDEKTRGNLSEPEQTLLSSALFELRLGFLEITQALARSAQQRAQSGGVPPPPAPGGPRIVR